MCGPNLPRPSLGGALAVLSAPNPSSAPSSNSSSSRSALAPAPAPALCGGSLIFHSPATETESESETRTPATVATHATFTPPRAVDTGTDELDLADYVVGIHASGDLLQPAYQSPILHRFGFGFRNGGGGGGGVDDSSNTRLATPLEIGVGGDGIIGRRVTVWRTNTDGAGGRFPVAEGIVGYN